MLHDLKRRKIWISRHTHTLDTHTHTHTLEAFKFRRLPYTHAMRNKKLLGFQGPSSLKTQKFKDFKNTLSQAHPEEREHVLSQWLAEPCSVEKETWP